MLYVVHTFNRIYLLCRLYALYSQWTNGTATYACEINECTANTLFAIKAGFKENPYFYLTSTMFIGTLVLGLCVRTVERFFFLIDNSYKTRLDLFTMISNLKLMNSILLQNIKILILSPMSFGLSLLLWLLWDLEIIIRLQFLGELLLLLQHL